MNKNLEQAHSERGQDSDWEICCDPTDDSDDSATGIATVINPKNGVKLIRGGNNFITVSKCGKGECTGTELFFNVPYCDGCW